MCVRYGSVPPRMAAAAESWMRGTSKVGGISTVRIAARQTSPSNATSDQARGQSLRVIAASGEQHPDPKDHERRQRDGLEGPVRRGRIRGARPEREQHAQHQLPTHEDECRGLDGGPGSPAGADSEQERDHGEQQHRGRQRIDAVDLEVHPDGDVQSGEGGHEPERAARGRDAVDRAHGCPRCYLSETVRERAPKRASDGVAPSVVPAPTGTSDRWSRRAATASLMATRPVRPRTTQGRGQETGRAA